MGYGFGMSLPTVLVAIQNAMEVRDIGIGSASVSFFRSMGGAFGVATMSMMLTSVLNQSVHTAMGTSVLGPTPEVTLLRGGASLLNTLPETVQLSIRASLEEAFYLVFIAGAAMSSVGAATALFLKELPLRSAVPIRRNDNVA
jgi:Asp/Glu/hydantoin racemase